jgi:hypothetical protein
VFDVLAWLALVVTALFMAFKAQQVPLHLVNNYDDALFFSGHPDDRLARGFAGGRLDEKVLLSQHIYLWRGVIRLLRHV